MKHPAVILLLAAGFSAAQTGAAEEAGKMLKVPPVADRPMSEGKSGSAAQQKAAGPNEPAEPTPAASPAGGEKSEAVAGPASDDITPETFPVSRYAALWENSPFQIESIAPPAQSESLAQRFILGGILRENGEPFVWVRERATQQSHKVGRNTTNNLGLSLVEVKEVMTNQLAATAILRLEGVQGEVGFDTAAGAAMGAGMAAPPPMARPFVPTPIRAPQGAMAQPLPGQAGFARPGQAAINPVQPGQVNPAFLPPGVVPPVPGPAVPANGQVQAQGQEMPPPRVIRRRAIVPAAPSTP